MSGPGLAVSVHFTSLSTLAFGRKFILQLHSGCCCAGHLLAFKAADGERAIMKDRSAFVPLYQECWCSFLSGLLFVSVSQRAIRPSGILVQTLLS